MAAEPMSEPTSVLVVDDDPLVRAILTQILGPHGFACTEAEDGQKAVDRLAVQRADLAVIDMLMPNKEGLETIQEIRARWPEVRIIAISGGNGRVDPGSLLRVAELMGADGVMPKPLEAGAFLDLVREVLAAPR